MHSANRSDKHKGKNELRKQVRNGHDELLFFVNIRCQLANIKEGLEIHFHRILEALHPFALDTKREILVLIIYPIKLTCFPYTLSFSFSVAERISQGKDQSRKGQDYSGISEYDHPLFKKALLPVANCWLRLGG